MTYQDCGYIADHDENRGCAVEGAQVAAWVETYWSYQVKEVVARLQQALGYARGYDPAWVSTYWMSLAARGAIAYARGGCAIEREGVAMAAYYLEVGQRDAVLATQMKAAA